MDDPKLEQLSFGEDNFLVIGIAASAVGKEALQAFLQTMPKNDNASILVDSASTQIKLEQNNSHGITVQIIDSNGSKLDKNYEVSLIQQQTEEALRKSATRERTTLKIVQKISKTLDCQEIFALTTKELRKALKCDRSVIYRFNQDWSGQFVAESVGDEWLKLVEVDKHKIWFDSYLQETKGGVCALDEIFVADNIYQAGLSRCHIDLLRQFQAKACCVVPIFQSDLLWGLLSVYQNNSTRQWQPEEIRLLTQVAIQLGITLKQADLFAQIRDRSDRLQQAKEAAEAANKAKTAFIAHMNHELRTPLNAILGSAEILRETINHKEQQNKIDLIYHSGKHLHTLINDVLSLAKLEAKKLKLKPKNFDFANFLTNVFEIIRIRAVQKNIELNYQIISSLPSTIFCDQTRLKQVLLNLLSNAIKFTPNGSVTFKIGYEKDFYNNKKGNNKQSIRFSIEDTGIGIAPTQIADIFLPFQQLKDNDLQTEGTGLGLTISQNIVCLMGSKIQVQSSLGKGSTFWFDLDLNNLINYKNIEDIEENIEPKTIVITHNKLQNIVIPPLSELYTLQELLIVGNIRGLLNKLADLEKYNPELNSFNQQVLHLAETCQIDLLESFLQSFT